ncbi:sensor of ECF-type sigma factor [Algibacter sp.]|uniref:sensor of ECF-type sigma factor n=1 Tax=Algibacter sp. TaxID=1872428 RepID=UPI003C742AB2
MKKLLPILLLLMVFKISAQDSKRERIKALKVSFITEKLDLTEKEAQKFWPVYNAHEDKTFQIKHSELKVIRKEVKEHLSTLTDAHAKELLDKLVAAENNLHTEYVNLISKLRIIIPAKKIIQLKAAEEDFKRKLFDEFKKRRQGK